MFACLFDESPLSYSSVRLSYRFDRLLNRFRYPFLFDDCPVGPLYHV